MSNEIDGEDLNPILDAIDAAEDIPDPLDGLVEYLGVERPQVVDQAVTPFPPKTGADRNRREVRHECGFE